MYRRPTNIYIIGPSVDVRVEHFIRNDLLRSDLFQVTRVVFEDNIRFPLYGRTPLASLSSLQPRSNQFLFFFYSSSFKQNTAPVC